jgi:transcription initiation factor TFIIIB Brf1 subunit/transcription initiation factor TFIIB
MLRPNQKVVMIIIMNWCKNNTTPISLIDIAKATRNIIPPATLRATLSSLIKKNYIRKAINTTPISYVKEFELL